MRLALSTSLRLRVKVPDLGPQVLLRLPCLAVYDADRLVPLPFDLISDLSWSREYLANDFVIGAFTPASGEECDLGT